MPLDINFNFKTAVYRPGDVIIGYVSVFLTKPSQSNGVVLDWSGRAYLHTKHGKESQNIFRTVQVLDREAEGNFPSGESRLEFRQRLPTSLPPSYASKNNHAGINFRLEAKLKRSVESGELTVSTEKVFYVVPDVELSDQQRNPAKVNSSSRGVACCLCCLPGIDISMSTDRGGYSPGEEIKITTIATNNSKHEITDLKLDLVQIVSFDSSVGYFYQREVVRAANTYDVRIPSQKSQFYLPHQIIKVPPLPPTCGYDSNKFKFSYALELFVNTPMFYRDMILSIPIKLGTFPLGISAQIKNQATLPIQGSILYVQAEGGLQNLTYISPSDNFFEEIVVSSDDETGVEGKTNPAFEDISFSGLSEGKHSYTDKPKYPFFTRRDGAWIVRYRRTIKERK